MFHQAAYCRQTRGTKFERLLDLNTRLPARKITYDVQIEALDASPSRGIKNLRRVLGERRQRDIERHLLQVSHGDEPTDGVHGVAADVVVVGHKFTDDKVPRINGFS